jgi:uncharacterized protein
LCLPDLDLLGPVRYVFAAFRRDHHVKFNVRDIDDAAKELRYDEPTQELTRLLAAPVADFRLPSKLGVALTYYRAGSDLFFQGQVDGDITGRCSRCLEEYEFPLAVSFALVFAPCSEGGQDLDLEQSDADLNYYDGDEVDLSPPLREQILLALPTRPICRESCAGLCPHCGVNRNTTTCDCREERGDPRLAVLRTLKLHP